MNAKKASRDAPGHPSKDEPARRGQDGNEAVHDSSGTARTNNVPNHELPTNGINAFLYWLHQDTPLDEDVLARKYAYYANTSANDRREDPAGTWEDTGLAAYGGERR